MRLFVIIESGSTKSDWVFLNSEGEEQLRTETTGLNPLVLSSDKMLLDLQGNDTLIKLSSQVKRLCFYGAGCKTESAKATLKQVFSQIFSNADIEIKTDMQAACHSVFEQEPCLVGILGTGSNACFFDGKEVIKKTPSLGFVLGDEGSGNHIGRLVITSFYNLSMPEELRQKFSEKFNLSVEELIQNVYRKPKPNAYLATFSTFAFENNEHKFIKNLIIKSFDDFLVNQILPYPESKTAEINFVGSVAYHYQDILKEAIQKRNLIFGRIIQRPVDGLIYYHKKIGLFK